VVVWFSASAATPTRALIAVPNHPHYLKKSISANHPRPMILLLLSTQRPEAKNGSSARTWTAWSSLRWAAAAMP
jgi:hypothetical protein